VAGRRFIAERELVVVRGVDLPKKVKLRDWPSCCDVRMTATHKLSTWCAFDLRFLLRDLCLIILWF